MEVLTFHHSSGLIDLTKNFNGTKWYVEPVSPGTVAKYQLAENGRAQLVEEKRFYQIGMRPFFKPWISYDSKCECV